MFQRHLLVLIFLGCPVAPVSASQFVVTDWLIGTAVVPPGGNGPAGGFTTPTNPFNQQHSFIWNASTAASSFAFAWDESAGTGNFLIEGQHTAQGVGSGVLQSGSSGSMILDVASDLLLTAHISYDYYLPLDVSIATVGLHVRRANPQMGEPAIFSIGAFKNSFSTVGISGTLSQTGQVVLPAGERWRIAYGMTLETLNAQPGGLATGNGHIQFSLTPIPEPGTLALLLLAAPLIPRRRRHRSRGL